MTTYIEFHLTLFLGAHDFRGLVGKVDRLKLRVIEKNSLYLIHGAYLGLSALPWLLAGTVVSMLSGHMLTRWVPEGIGDALRNGTVTFWHTPAAMWLILGLVALVGPFVALLFRDWFTKGARWKVAEKTAQPDGDDLANLEPSPADLS